jgi:hypothetical protein
MRSSSGFTELSLHSAATLPLHPALAQRLLGQDPESSGEKALMNQAKLPAAMRTGRFGRRSAG